MTSVRSVGTAAVVSLPNVLHHHEYFLFVPRSMITVRTFGAVKEDSFRVENSTTTDLQRTVHHTTEQELVVASLLRLTGPIPILRTYYKANHSNLSNHEAAEHISYKLGGGGGGGGELYSTTPDTTIAVVLLLCL